MRFIRVSRGSTDGAYLNFSEKYFRSTVKMSREYVILTLSAVQSQS